MFKELRTRIIVIVIVGLLTTVTAACIGENTNNDPDDDTNSNEQSPSQVDNDLYPPVENEENPENIESIIQDMSLSEKIGQLVIVGVEDKTIDSQIEKMIEEQHVSGVILFSRNLLNVEQSVGLINDLKQANHNGKLPLFIGVDEEGGKITRLPDELIPTPSSREIGSIDSPQFSFNIGQLIARKTSSFGFNMNFAPVMDIDSNPENPVIGDRSFGSDSKKVSELGVEQMKGMISQHIIPVVKHFPGHGDTSVDSHIDLPVVHHDQDRLQSFELQPFKKAIQHGVDAIMVAHLLVRAYDDQYPATMSKPIITDLLREELGFEGVVVTDDMTMGAILENYDIGEAAVQSINAGSDLLLVCHGYDQAATTLDALKTAVRSGKISESRINQSVHRILTLKEKYRLTDNLIKHVNVNEINQLTEDTLSRIN